jgi:hypothetical protein
MEWVVNATSQPLYPREWPGIRGWVGARASLEGCGNFVPTGIRFPDRTSRGDYTDYSIPPIIIIIIIIISSSSSSSSSSSISINSRTVAVATLSVKKNVWCQKQVDGWVIYWEGFEWKPSYRAGLWVGRAGSLPRALTLRGAPKRQSPTGHTLIRSTVAWWFSHFQTKRVAKNFFKIWLYWL